MTDRQENSLKEINTEILKLMSEKFTGQVTVDLKMNQGGIGQANIIVTKVFKFDKK